MRIPSGVTDQYVYFVAVDATDFTTRETGLSSFTVYRSRNGGAAAAMTTPTINETDATNMPGVYELLLDEDMTIDSGDDEQEMVFHITHAGMAAVTRAVTLFRPKITAGNTLGVESDGDLTKVNTLDGHTAQTGDSFARLGAPAGASVSADIADIPTVSEFNARTLAAADYFDPAADPVANVTLVATTTTNTDMRGTDNAATATALTTVEGKIDTIDTNVDTLLTRVTATLFSGITSLAEWLGLLAGKQTGDATARTELRATGAGSGTFDEATDSLEAVRDRGDAAWTTGAGGSSADAYEIKGEIGRTSGGTYYYVFWLEKNGQMLTSGLSAAGIGAYGNNGDTDLSFTTAPGIQASGRVVGSGTLGTAVTDNQPVVFEGTVTYDSVAYTGQISAVAVA